MKVPRIELSRRGMLLVALVALAGVALLMTMRPSAPAWPMITLLPRSYVSPPPRISLFARVVPATRSWAWLWQLKEKLFGKIRPIEISAELIKLPNTNLPGLGSADLERPGSAESPGLSVWVLDQNRLKALRQRLKQTPGAEFMNSPRMVTGDNIQASLFSGNSLTLNGLTNEIGLRAEFLPRISQERTELTVGLAYLESVTNQALVSVRTNLDLKARFLLARDKGVLLIQSSTNARPLAVLISTKL